MPKLRGSRAERYPTLGYETPGQSCCRACLTLSGAVAYGRCHENGPILIGISSIEKVNRVVGMSKRGSMVVAGLLALAPMAACEGAGGEMVILDVNPRVGATQG